MEGMREEGWTEGGHRESPGWIIVRTWPWLRIKISAGSIGCIPRQLQGAWIILQNWCAAISKPALRLGIATRRAIRAPVMHRWCTRERAHAETAGVSVPCTATTARINFRWWISVTDCAFRFNTWTQGSFRRVVNKIEKNFQTERIQVEM